MEALPNRLLSLLEEETELYAALLLVLQKEKKAVVDSNLEALNGVTKEKENLILKIRILEEQRSDTLNRLAEELGHAPKGLTLTKLSKLVDAPHATRLKACCSNLTALIQSIQEVNRSNQMLLRHSLELVKGSLSLLNHLMPPGPVYRRSGQIAMREQNGRVLSGRI